MPLERELRTERGREKAEGGSFWVVRERKRHSKGKTILDRNTPLKIKLNARVIETVENNEGGLRQMLNTNLISTLFHHLICFSFVSCPFPFP